MIYGNSIDTNDAPDPGWTGLCVNCRLDISGHKGWRCKAKIPVGLATHMAEHRFDKLWGVDRFETHAMQAVRFLQAGQVSTPAPATPALKSHVYVPRDLVDARTLVCNQTKHSGSAVPCQRHGFTIARQPTQHWKFDGAEVCGLCAVELHGGNIIDLEADVQRMTAGQPVVVLHSRSNIPNPLMSGGKIATVVVAAKVEVEPEPSWRQWRDKNRAAGECACGIVRTMCSYHRESL